MNDSEAVRLCAEASRLLGEWRKLHAAHCPAIQEFKGGYQPFLDRATREFLDSAKMQQAKP